MATVRNVASPGRSPIYEYYGKDNKRYNTMEAAEAADKAYDAQFSNTRGRTLNATGSAGGSTSGKPSQITLDFLKRWGDITDQSISTLNDIISGKSGGTDYPGSSEIRSLIDQIGGQLNNFNEQYGGIESESINQAMADLGARNTLRNQFMTLARPDYAGEAGRAAMDVRASSERAMGANAREAMSYGLDPTAGKFGALTKQGYLGQARNEAIAMNIARRNEKDRVSNMTTQGLSLIDPSKTYSIAKDITGTRSGLITNQANLELANTDAAMKLNQMRSDAAMKIADIGNEYGSAGMTMLGIEEGKNAEIPGSTISSGTGLQISHAPMTGNIVLNPQPQEQQTTTTDPNKKTLSFGG